MNFNRYIKLFTEDFQQPVSYLIPAVFYSAILVTLFLILRRSYSKESGHRMAGVRLRNVAKPFVWVLFLSYMMILIQTVFFSREPGSRIAVSLKLFETWGTTPVMHAYFIENIIMFIPLGIFLPALFRKMRKVWCCVPFAFVCSCAIEIAQYVTGRGYLQVDDIMTNTAGALIGWLVWILLHFCSQNRKNVIQ